MNHYFVEVNKSGSYVHTEFEANEHYEDAFGRYHFLDDQRRDVRILTGVTDVQVEYDVDSSDESSEPTCDQCGPQTPDSHLVIINGLELLLNQTEYDKLRIFLKYLV